MQTIRRVPPFALWAVLAALWILLLKIFWPDARAFEYFQSPIYMGVLLVTARRVPKKHATWLPPLIGLSVTIPVVLGWKALS